MTTSSNQATVETLKDFGKEPEATQKRYVAEIDLYESGARDFRDRADKIVQIYRDERGDDKSSGRATKRKFALLWSNVETLKPAIYARLPKADVQRRFKDQDPTARLACELAERALDYTIQCDDRFDTVMREGTEDYLLAGQGVCWQRFVPHFKSVDKRISVQQMNPEEREEGVQISNEMDDALFQDDKGNEYGQDKVQLDAQGQYVMGETEISDYEEIVDDYVSYTDWGHNSGARIWAEVYLTWRKAFLTRDELHERFDSCIGKEEVDSIPLDYMPQFMDDKKGDEVKDLFKKACIYELWDKSTHKVAWVHKSYMKSCLDEVDDPLNLDEFFPCPKPMWATTTTNTLIPVPDYVFYQDQAEEINDLTNRIGIIEKAIRVRGLYPGNVDAFRQLLTMSDDNDMVSMDQAAVSQLASMGVGDLSKAVYFWPIDILVAAVKSIIEIRKQIIEDVYQITGIGDILRGQSDPNETAAAQEIKSQWGSLRVKNKQQEVQRFARDLLRIKFQIIFNKYEDETIWKMADAQNIPDIQNAGKAAVQKFMQMAQQQAMMPPGMAPMPPQQPSEAQIQAIDQQGQQQAFMQAIKLLRDQAMRQFRVDVQTDSTVAVDDTAEKRSVNELLEVMGGFFKNAGPVIMAQPEMAKPVGELFMYVLRRYKASQAVESAFETAIQAIGNKPSGGDNGKAQAQQQIEQTKQMQIQQKGQETAINAQLEQGNQEIERGRLGLDGIALERDPNPQVTLQ